MSSSQITPKPLQIAAAVIGNALEWYDFIVFGFFTVITPSCTCPSTRRSSRSRSGWHARSY